MAQCILSYKGVNSKNLSYSPMKALHLRCITLTSFTFPLQQWTGGVLLLILINDLSHRTRQKSNKCIADIGKKLIIYL